jgi:diketogulonate reductase-like aldo/keto reductase
MVSARDDGLIGAVGLSNVSLAQLEQALQLTDVACVQNEFNPVDRGSQPVLEECTRRGIAFVPFGPLGFGSTSVLANPTLAKVAARLGCTPVQACLSWELEIAPNLLLIPGTSSRRHLHENLAASQIRLDIDALHVMSQLHR